MSYCSLKEVQSSKFGNELLVKKDPTTPIMKHTQMNKSVRLLRSSRSNSPWSLAHWVIYNCLHVVAVSMLGSIWIRSQNSRRFIYIGRRRGDKLYWNPDEKISPSRKIVYEANVIIRVSQSVSINGNIQDIATFYIFHKNKNPRPTKKGAE